MPWNATQEHAGFSQAQPWLPIASEHGARAVAQQAQVENSVLNAYRQFCAWRKTQSALQGGSIKFVASSKNALAFIRRDEAQAMLCAFNFSGDNIVLTLDATYNLSPLVINPSQTLSGHAGQLTLMPYGSFFAALL
jgi:alpha-glucosidase